MATDLSTPPPTPGSAVLDGHRRVVRPALVVGRRALDGGLLRSIGQPRGCHLKIYSPTRVVVERPAAIGPPRVRTGDIGMQASHHVDERTARSDQRIEPGTFLGEEAGLLEVRFPRGDVGLGVPD